MFLRVSVKYYGTPLNAFFSSYAKKGFLSITAGVAVLQQGNIHWHAGSDLEIYILWADPPHSSLPQWSNAPSSTPFSFQFSL